MEQNTLTVENLLGEKALQQYSDIFPVLSLIFYDATNRYPKTKSFDMLFNYDEEDMDLPKGVMRKLFTPLHRKELANRRKSAEKLPDKAAVMLSHTFVHNLRYTKTLAEIKKHCDVTHFLSECDTRIIVNRSGVKFIPSSFTVKPVMWQGSISGAKLKDAVVAVERYFLDIIARGDTCEGCFAETQQLFDALRTEYTARIQLLTETLKKHKITKYITINQYNLRDVMIITALRKLGIPTQQMEHHSSQCIYPADQKLPILRFAYTDSFCCWSESDLHFHKTFMEYQPMFGQQVELCAVGNPEISFENASAEYAKYPAKNQIVYMMSAIINEKDEALVQSDFEMQQKIFAQLAQLGEKTGCDVLVRFPPAINPRMQSLCTPVAEQLGLKISRSSNASLMEDMCTSRVMFGTVSSVMSTAVIMGRKVYRISDVKPLFTEKEITVVKIDDISKISDDWAPYPLPLEKNRFIDYNLLLK